MTDADIEKAVRDILVQDFEVDESALTPETNLFTDLDLDSIDAIDLTVRLQQETGRKVNPEDFKSIRTIADVVAAVKKLLADGEAKAE